MIYVAIGPLLSSIRLFVHMSFYLCLYLSVLSFFLPYSVSRPLEVIDTSSNNSALASGVVRRGALGTSAFNKPPRATNHLCLSLFDNVSELLRCRCLTRESAAGNNFLHFFSFFLSERENADLESISSMRLQAAFMPAGPKSTKSCLT